MYSIRASEASAYTTDHLQPVKIGDYPTFAVLLLPERSEATSVCEGACIPTQMRSLSLAHNERAEK